VYGFLQAVPEKGVRKGNPGLYRARIGVGKGGFSGGDILQRKGGGCWDRDRCQGPSHARYGGSPDECRYGDRFGQCEAPYVPVMLEVGTRACLADPPSLLVDEPGTGSGAGPSCSPEPRALRKVGVQTGPGCVQWGARACGGWVDPGLDYREAVVNCWYRRALKISRYETVEEFDVEKVYSLLMPELLLLRGK